RRRLDSPAVDEGAVEASQVLDQELVAVLREDGVLTRDGHVVEEDVVVRRAADGRPLSLRNEMLAGAAAARADDQSRAVARDLVECAVLVRDLLGRGRRRRLAPRLVDNEERAALRAVVRRLRVLEAALRAVDEAQWPVRCRCGLPGTRKASQGRTQGASISVDMSGAGWAMALRFLAGDVRGRLAGEDRGQRFDVDALEHTFPAGLLEPGHQLRTQDVDLAVEDPALVGDLPLLFLERVDLLLEVVIGQRSEIR